jgi:alpha/beta superfamily hydrolase
MTTKTTLVFIIIFFSTKSIGQKYFDFGKDIENLEQYNSKDINFIDPEENISLCGTLIFPKTEYSKIVVITPGSGKDTRNSHYVIAEELLKNGIAVYRYDDRGVGKSEGTANYGVDQIIKDLYYAFKNIRKIDTLSQKKIGIIGHSLGGIATINAYQQELNIDFFILMSTPIEKYSNFKHKQFKSKNNTKIKISSEDLFQQSNIPILFISGTNDSFFNSVKTSNLFLNLNKKNIQVKSLNGLNHFLRTGNDDWLKTRKYNSLYEIDKTALNEIINWIKPL